MLSASAQRLEADNNSSGPVKFKLKSLIVPCSFISFGVIGLESHTIKQLNKSTSGELKEHIDKALSIDDFSQYAPFASVYVLDVIGIKSKNNLVDKTVILATAYISMGSIVNILKLTSHEQRPDSSSFNSFPSGHTATAFMGAEFLFQELKTRSIWYGISGYLIAAGTGYFRMYNNRHWLTDVAAGAGIGLLSTKIAYWIQPFVKRKLFKKNSNISGTILPTPGGKGYGLTAVINF